MSKMISMCGLDCAACPARMAFLTDDQALREKTAREWAAAFHADISPAMVNCVGCTLREGVHIGHCAECAIRTCGLARNAGNCGLCADYESCATIGEFIAKVPPAKANLEEVRAARRA